MSTAQHARERSYTDKLVDAINLLNIDPLTINTSTLKKAYRDAAINYHPDMNGGDDSAKLIFEEVNTSNQLILDEISDGGHILRQIIAEWETIIAKRKAEQEQAQKPRFDNNNAGSYDGIEPKTKPYAHQVMAFNRFKDSEYFAAFWDMGTGKSKLAIDIAAYKYNTGEIDAVMIIAPNNVHLQWYREQFPMHCPIAYDPFVWDQSKWSNSRYRNAYDKFMDKPSNVLKVFFMNVEAFQGGPGQQFTKYFVRANRVFVVLDEATRIKTPEAKRSIAIRKLNSCTARCILTGTPTAKSPLDIWSPFNFLKDDYFSMSWMGFRAEYSVMIKDVASKRQRTVNDYEFTRVKDAIASWQGKGDLYDCLGAVAAKLGMTFSDVRFIHNSEEVQKHKNENALLDIISKDTTAVKKEDCLDLPEKVYEIIETDMCRDQRKAYDQLATYMAAILATGEEVTVKAVIALLIRFMQVCGGFFPEKTEGMDYTVLHKFSKNPKLDVLMEDIEENTHDKQAIVWACFTAEIKLIRDELRAAGYTAETIMGEDKKDKRERTIAKFANGDVQFLVANPTVAGYGFNFQFCSHQYFFSNSYRTEARLQAEDRTHRSGQTQTCIYKDILIRNSIDAHIFQIIKEGKALNDVFRTLDDIEDAL